MCLTEQPFYQLNVAVDVRGNNGKLLSEFYKSQGGPTAYLGTTAPGFPNMFTLMGPNTVTGHASVIFSEESQVCINVSLYEAMEDFSDVDHRVDQLYVPAAQAHHRSESPDLRSTPKRLRRVQHYDSETS